MVLTGSDPLKRPDLFLLIRKCVELGLRTTVSPSATAFLSREAIREFEKEGVKQMVVAMDDAMAPSFDCTMEALEEAGRIGLATQVQTTVTRWTMYLLEDIADRVERAGARVWSLFLDALNDKEFKEVFESLCDISQRVPFEVRVADYTASQVPQSNNSDERGFVFISHIGEIHPSGFLAVSAGNVRRDSLVDVYRNSSLFSILRGTFDYPVECRGCSSRNVCGGSRARAYALTGALPSALDSEQIRSIKGAWSA
jgi:MoaA/NifB/PqqE/SkfB family radical SAM enzyme